MSNMMGMDIDAVRQLGTQLQQKGEEINGIMASLTSQLNSVQWQGPDAQQFRGSWDGELRTMLTNVVNQLRDAGQKAHRNAEEQQQASSSL